MRLPILAALLVAVPTTTVAVGATNNWIFRQGYYTHSPISGMRVAQYQPLPRIAPLPDSRAVTSGYHRSRTTLRGPGGTVDDYYLVQNWGNGRGGLDAEWERFHDAWRNSFLSGGYGYTGGHGYGGGWPGYGGPGPGGPGYGGWGPGQGGWAPGQGGWAPGQGGWAPGQGGWQPGFGPGGVGPVPYGGRAMDEGAQGVPWMRGQGVPPGSGRASCLDWRCWLATTTRARAEAVTPRRSNHGCHY